MQESSLSHLQGGTKLRFVLELAPISATNNLSYLLKGSFVFIKAQERLLKHVVLVGFDQNQAQQRIMRIAPSNAGQHQKDSEPQGSARLLTPDTQLEPSVHANLHLFSSTILLLM